MRQASKDKCGKCVSNPTETCGRDCKGAWGGKAQRDFCGLCGGNNSTCIDCKGCALSPSTRHPRHERCRCGAIHDQLRNRSRLYIFLI